MYCLAPETYGDIQTYASPGLNLFNLVQTSFCEFALKNAFLVEGCNNFPMINDGECNVETNNAECYYDGGDCCGYDCTGPNCQCYHQGNLFWGIAKKIAR